MGNDIVDLDSPYVKGKSGDLKFVQRVLTPDEQSVLSASEDPDTLLQTYWAAKETAYKAATRTDPGISSAPRRYRVCLDREKSGSDIQGRVKTPRSTVFFSVRGHGGCIHCFGATLFKAKGRIIHGFEELTGRFPPDFERSSADVSYLARGLAIKKIAAFLSTPESRINIIKSDGRNGSFFPRVCVNQKERTDISLSLSHDGRFLAYAILFSADSTCL